VKTRGADVNPLEPREVYQTFVIPLHGRLGLIDRAAGAEGLLVGLGPLTLSSALTERLVHGFNPERGG
jgi:hypothetical protein